MVRVIFDFPSDRPIHCYSVSSKAEAVTAANEVTGSNIDNVADIASLLSNPERDELENKAKSISKSYACGVYIVTVDDYQKYGTGKGDVFDITTQIYHAPENGFGEGANRDGIILLLSMRERDWALFVYGETAEYAFNRYGQKQLEKVFLDNFGDNDWYGGFSDYIGACEEYLAAAEAGKPVRANPITSILTMAFMSSVVALLVCLVLKSKMKSVHREAAAIAYIAGDGLVLAKSYDNYTHTTTTRRKIEKEKSSSSREGGGGSGRSGKF